MNPTIRLLLQNKTAAAALAVAAITAVALLFVATGKTPDEPVAGSRLVQNPASPAAPAELDFSALARAFIPDGTRGKGWLATRFRLAGIVHGVSANGDNELIAIIDDRTEVRQRIAFLGQEIVPGVKVSKINAAADTVTLSAADGEEEISLDKNATASHATAPKTPAASADAEKGSRADYAKRFGGYEVFPGRWNFNRESVLDYYAKLRDEPQRLLSVFDSMDPVYEKSADGADTITGYVVAVKGEPDFFEAAGLKQGDIVRAVNTVPMHNRRRAEGFITSFVQGESGTFILEIERGGKIEKQAYVIE